MFIESIVLKNVRNLKDYHCDFTPGINLIYGKNGKGKTTILEAIYSLSMGKSFKSGKRNNMINFESDNFFISGRIKYNEHNSTTINVACLGDNRKITINKKPIPTILDLIDMFPVVVMAPENIILIEGSSVTRRSFFDRLFSIVDKQYLLLLKDYGKILQQRRILLIEKNDEMVNLWSDKMAEKGIVLWEKRKQYFNQFFKLFKATWPSDIKDISANIRYAPKSVTIKDEFILKLDKLMKEEFLKKQNLYGPHKDDYLFEMNNASARFFSSQGEKKLFLTVLKNTECKFIEHYLEKQPVLLLDDLLAKFDTERGYKIIEMLKTKHQSVITSTNQSVKELISGSSGEIHTIELV